MPFVYARNEAFVMNLLRVANDPIKSPIRARLLGAERQFWRKYIVNKDVLVIGSGLGDDSFVLAKSNRSVVGIDLLPSLIEIAEQRQVNEGIVNVEFVAADLFQWVPTHKFDVAVLNMGTIGNFDDPISVMHRMLELAPRGYFDFYLPDEQAMNTRFAMYRQEGFEGVIRAGSLLLNYQGLHSESFDPLELQELALIRGVSLIAWPLCDFAIMAMITKI